MSERLVFGEADPRAYMEPLCATCDHPRSDHEGVEGREKPCWRGWSEDDKCPDAVGGDGPEGCECLDFLKTPLPVSGIAALRVGGTDR